MFHSLKASSSYHDWRSCQNRANTHHSTTSQISVSRAFDSFYLLKAPAAVNSSSSRINLFSNKITKNENKQILPISPDTKASTLNRNSLHDDDKAKSFGEGFRNRKTHTSREHRSSSANKAIETFSINEILNRTLLLLNLFSFSPSLCNVVE